MLPLAVRQMLLGWHKSFVGKKREKKVRRATPICLFWTVWKERNSKTFENEGHLVQGLKLSFLCNLWA